MITTRAAGTVTRCQRAAHASRAAGDAFTCKKRQDKEAWLLLDTIIGPVAKKGLEQELDTTRFEKQAVRRSSSSGSSRTSPEENEEEHEFLPRNTIPRFEARMNQAGDTAYAQMESSFRKTGGWPSASQVAVRILLLLRDMPQDGATALSKKCMLELQATYPSLRQGPWGSIKPSLYGEFGSRSVQPEQSEIVTDLHERMSVAVQSCRAQLITGWENGEGWLSLADQSSLQLHYLFAALPKARG